MEKDVKQEVAALNAKTERQLGEFKKKFDTLNEKAKVSYEESLAEIEGMSDQIQKKRKDLITASENKQAELKQDLEKLEHALEKSIKAFEKEMER